MEVDDGVDLGGGEDVEEEIRQDDSWTVISAYFEEKGLVRQQLDSFNEFLEHSLQEIVEVCCCACLKVCLLRVL